MPYIDGLPTAASVSPDDLIVVDQGGNGTPGSATTRSAKVSQLLPTASTTVLGGVKVDGSTVVINGSGVISATGGGGGGVTSVVGATGAVTLADLVTGGVAPNTYLSPLTGGVSRTLNGKLTDIVSVKDFGAVGDGTADDTAAFNACLAAVDGTGKAAYVPAGKYLVSLLNTVNAVTIQGDGMGVPLGNGAGASTIITNTTVGDVLQVSGWLDISGIQFTATSQRDPGSYIFCHPNTNSSIVNCSFDKYGIGINAFGNTGTIRDCHFTNPAKDTGVGIFVNGAAGGLVIDNVIMYVPSVTPLAGIQVAACGSLNIDNSGIMSQNSCLLVNPGNGQGAFSIFANNTYFDTAQQFGVLIQPTGTGIVARCEFTQCEMSSAGSSGTVVGNSGVGIVQGISFINCQMCANGVDGLAVNATSVTDINVIGGVYAGNMQNGILFEANVNSFTVLGARAGVYGGFPGNAAHGIAVAAGSSNDYVISDCRTVGNGGGTIFDGGTGSTKFVGDNPPTSSPGGSGTVLSGTAGTLAFYPASGTTVSSSGAVYSVVSSVETLGIGSPGTSNGQIDLSGSASGTTGIGVPAAAGNYVLTLPPNPGTSGFFLTTSGTGVCSWQPVTSAVGVTNGSNATPGLVGEYISASVAAGSAVGLTTDVSANVTSITLTAGDWDVSGNIALTASAGAGVTNMQAWLNTTSATVPVQPNGGAYSILNILSGTLIGSGTTLSAGSKRISITSNTTVFLSTFMQFASGTMSAYGFIGARRAR